METIERYGSEEQKKQWLEPLLAGAIRSTFLMTEPEVASSDATNIQCKIARDGEEYVINGHKWWSSGAGDPRCAVYILMGKTNPDAPKHQQQSMVLVPANAPGITVHRPLTIFGYDDAPHGHMEITLKDVRVPCSNLLLGEGRGFEIAQGRLGPGRIHHCMRSIGAAERALELMVERLLNRTAFRKQLAEHSVWEQRVADARTNIEMCRLLVLKAAWMMDVAGAKNARSEIAQIKVAAPRMALQVIDDAIQAFGGAGVSADTPLAELYATVRTLRIADGPHAGYGECAPLVGLHRERLDECVEAIERWSDGEIEFEAMPPSAAFAASCAIETAEGFGTRPTGPVAVAAFFSLSRSRWSASESLPARPTRGPAQSERATSLC
jgi:alkylation response protein AidB-like acyl-CoA dehydrogenase